jgi:DeoR/GlpR family transcriptional regulator of sugar metabolism
LTTFERRKRLLELLQKEPGLRVPEVAAMLGVSQGTIRNDLKALADEKQLIRVRGGAAVPTDSVQTYNSSFATRARTNEDVKDIIGRKAAALVEDGDAILLDASTTVFHMVRYLQDRRNLRVVTNGIEVARFLAQNPTNMVILVGGILHPETESVTGPWSERFIQDVCTKIAFISCSGFTTEGGMTDVNIYEAQFRKKALGSTNRVIALIDSSKFGKMDLAPSIRIDQISHIYTDSNITPEWVAKLEQAGMAFTICESGEVHEPVNSPVSLNTTH